VGPDNTTVQLFSNGPGSGGTGANFTNTIFGDAFGTPIQNATQAPFNGFFAPQTPLAVDIGKSVIGTWKLVIHNNGNHGDTANLTGWALGFLKPNPINDVGQPVADQATVSF